MFYEKNYHVKLHNKTSQVHLKETIIMVVRVKVLWREYDYVQMGKWLSGVGSLRT